MSYRRTPFQFNPDLSSDERRSEILRRFGFQPEEDNMFYETNSPSWSTDWASRFHRPGFYEDPEWRNTGSVFSNPGSGPSSPQSRMRRGWTADHDEGGVPIKVVHEGSSSGATRGFHDDGDAASETSSQGSRSSCSSGRSVGASSKTRHEPRVHHIPIMVEPRTGSSSSGYASDGELKQGRKVFAAPGPVDHTAAGDTKYVHAVPIEVDRPAPHPRKPPQDLQDQEMTEENVRVIPIEVDYGGEAMARRKVDDGMNGPAATDGNWAHTFPRQKSQQASKNPASASKSSSGGKLGPQGGSSSDKGSKVQKQQKDQKQKPSAEEQLRQIDVDLVGLRQQVLGFQGTPGDKQFKYLDEMLTRLMLKLDLVDPAGNETIRKLRKSMIKEVQQTINRLEGKDPTDALIETGPQELEIASGENSPTGAFSSCATSPGATTPGADNLTRAKSPGGKSGSESPGDTVGNLPEPSAKSEYISFNDTSSECKSACRIQKEADATVTSEAQPSRNVEMPSAGSSGPSAGEVNLPEPAAVPMPVDIDSSMTTNAGDAEQSSSGTPINEQCLTSLNESEMERSLAETSLPSEHSGSTEL